MTCQACCKRCSLQSNPNILKLDRSHQSRSRLTTNKQWCLSNTTSPDGCSCHDAFICTPLTWWFSQNFCGAPYLNHMPGLLPFCFDVLFLDRWDKSPKIPWALLSDINFYFHRYRAVCWRQSEAFRLLYVWDTETMLSWVCQHIHRLSVFWFQIRKGDNLFFQNFSTCMLS